MGREATDPVALDRRAVGGERRPRVGRLRPVLGQDLRPPTALDDRSNRGRPRPSKPSVAQQGREPAPGVGPVDLGARPADVDARRRGPRPTAMALTGRPQRPSEKQPPASRPDPWPLADVHRRRSRATSSGNVTSRYARLAQTMATEQRVSITCGRLMFRTRSAAASDADQRARATTGACVRRGTRASALREREVVVPGHREDEPDRAGVDGQGADEHGEDDIDQEQRPQAGPQDVLDDQRQAAGDLAELGTCRVADGAGSPRRSAGAGQPGGGQRLEDRPRGRGGAGRRSPRPGCRPCRSRTARTRPSAPRPGTGRDSPRDSAVAAPLRVEQDRRAAAGARASRSPIRSTTPTSSAMTPTLLIRAISRTPTALITVVARSGCSRGGRRSGRYPP